MESFVKDAIKLFKPDIAHGHAVQNIGFNFANVLNEDSIPVVVTLHDCLWLCERQFMVNNYGRYCNQVKIDSNVCLYCTDNPSLLKERDDFFSRTYKFVDKFLFPSEFHMNLHLQNGFETHKTAVSKNGVTFPKKTYERKPSQTVRFGFIGGPGYIKGGELIKEVFRELEGDFILKLVDAGANLDQSWKQAFAAWNLEKDRYEIIPGYTQDTIDDFFSEIDVLLFPSQWKESFGLTVREALVRDVWVIATNGGGTVEDIRDGVNGTVIPLVSSPLALEKAVKNCVNKNWNGYSNPYKSDITSYVHQANELNNSYTDLISE